MRLGKQLEVRSNGRASLRALANRALRECMTQDQYLTQREAIIEALPEFPRTIRQWVREHGEGYMHAIRDHHLTHLYCVDGQLYRHGDSRTPPELMHLPRWETLPRERWSDMPGGLYWVNKGDPRRHF